MAQIDSTFLVNFQEAEGTLLRLVGLIERRQFTITGLVFMCDNDVNGAVFRVKTMTIDQEDHDHRLAVLIKQIEKIENILGVNIDNGLELQSL
jgi:acetolactate synthase small subunit